MQKGFEGGCTMKKSHMFFGLASLAVILYGIDKYGDNAACYEIIPPQGQFDTMLLDRCEGQTFLLVKKDLDEDGDGKTDGYSYRWTTMSFNEGGEVFWEEKK